MIDHAAASLTRVVGVSVWLGLVAAPVATAQELACSWPARGDVDSVNVAFPDEAATYWIARFVAVPGSRIHIRGHYPDARYFSFHVYDEGQKPVDSLPDYLLEPDVPGSNPFRTYGAPPGGAYEAVIVFEEADDPEPNTIHAGQMRERPFGAAVPNPAGFILFRIYLPDDPSDPTGGVPLPRLSLEAPGVDAALDLGQCEPLPPSTDGAINAFVRESSWPNDIPSPFPVPGSQNPPFFDRAFGLDRAAWNRVDENGPLGVLENNLKQKSVGFLSNLQVAYMTSIIARRDGEMFVFRAKAPTTPDTRAGEEVVPDPDDPAASPPEVRYWSVCQNSYYTERVVDCVTDYEARVDDDGFFVFVVADPARRPSPERLAEPGVNWLPWGGVYPGGIVMYRHMIADPSFLGAIHRVTEDRNTPETLAEDLGDYYPVAGYCDAITFDTGGWQACLDATENTTGGESR